MESPEIQRYHEEQFKDHSERIKDLEDRRASSEKEQAVIATEVKGLNDKMDMILKMLSEQSSSFVRKSVHEITIQEIKNDLGWVRKSIEKIESLVAKHQDESGKKTDKYLYFVVTLLIATGVSYAVAHFSNLAK